jgi:hypothetical protein
LWLSQDACLTNCTLFWPIADINSSNEHIFPHPQQYTPFSSFLNLPHLIIAVLNLMRFLSFCFNPFFSMYILYRCTNNSIFSSIWGVYSSVSLSSCTKYLALEVDAFRAMDLFYFFLAPSSLAFNLAISCSRSLSFPNL